MCYEGGVRGAFMEGREPKMIVQVSAKMRVQDKRKSPNSVKSENLCKVHDSAPLSISRGSMMCKAAAVSVR